MLHVERRTRDFLLLGTFTLGACTLLNPLEGYSSGNPAVADASVRFDGEVPEASFDSAVEAGSEACVGAVPPAPPPRGGVEGSREIQLAFSSFDFSDVSGPSDPNTRGYNLDGYCTVSAAGGSCRAKRATVQDFAQGVDNSAGGFLLSLTTLIRSVPETEKIRAGQRGQLMRIRNYNELDDDDSVEVGIYNTGGFEAADGGPTAPKRDGTDVWSVDSRSVLGGASYDPVVADIKAYVRGGVLVAKLSNYDIRLASYVVPVASGVLSARITKTSTGRFALEDGIFSGRINAQELLTKLDTLRNPITGTFLCGTDSVFTGLRDQFCQSVLDIPTDPAASKDAPCDAASFAIRYTAVEAKLGRIVTLPPAERGCGSTWVGRCE